MFILTFAKHLSINSELITQISTIVWKIKNDGIYLQQLYEFKLE